MTTTFAQAVLTQPVRTTNGMKALAGTGDACVNFFYAAGASRGKDILPAFIAAYQENPEYAIRTALWLRDAREGAGERKLFKDICNWLEQQPLASSQVAAIIKKIPELGRWDDGFCFNTPTAKHAYFTLVGDAIRDGQRAKHLLPQVSKMTEGQAQKVLHSLV